MLSLVRGASLGRKRMGMMIAQNVWQPRLLSSATDAFVFEVDDKSFPEKVMKAKVPVIVDVYADWCGPCKTLGPLLEKAVKAQKGKVIMAKVNADSSPRLSQGLGVKSLPTVLGVFQGKLVEQFVGSQPEDVVEQFVKRIAASETGEAEPGVESPEAILGQAEKILEQVSQAFETQGDQAPYEQMTAPLRQMAGLKLDTDDKGFLEREKKVRGLAHVALARCALLAGEPEQAEEIIKVIKRDFDIILEMPEVASLFAQVKLGQMASSTKDDGTSVDTLLERRETLSLDEKLDLARALFGNKRYEEGIREVFDILKKDKNFQDGAAQKLLIDDVFEALGPKHELTLSTRRRLTSILLN